MDVFVQACSGQDRMLFIRQSVETDLPWDRARTFSRDQAEEAVNGMVGALRRRFPNLDFHILLVSPDTDKHNTLGSSEDVIFVTLRRQQEKGWSIADRDWDALLASVPYAPGQAAPPPKEVLHGI